MGFNVLGLFSSDDTAEQYANAIRHLADRQLDAVRDTNRTGLLQTQLSLDHSERSEMRWQDYLSEAGPFGMPAPAWGYPAPAASAWGYPGAGWQTQAGTSLPLGYGPVGGTLLNTDLLGTFMGGLMNGGGGGGQQQSGGGLGDLLQLGATVGKVVAGGPLALLGL